MQPIRTVRLVLAAVMLAMTAADLCAGRLALRVRKSVCLDRPVVMLSDIADIAGTDDALRERLATLVVMQVPADLKQASAGVFEISRTLAGAGVNPVTADIYGARFCQLELNITEKKPVADIPPAAVQPAIQPGKTIADQIIDFIVRTTGLEKDHLLIDFDGREAEFLRQPANETRFTIKPLSPVTLGNVRFDILDGDSDRKTESGAVIDRTRITSDIRYISESVVAVRPMRPGQILSKDDVRIMPVTLADPDRRGVERVDEVIGRELSRSVSSNETIMPWMVKRITLIRRNDEVDILNEYRGVCIALQGKAMLDGGDGDVISVQVKNSPSVLRCQVLAPGRVQVVTAAGDIRLASRGEGAIQP